MLKTVLEKVTSAAAAVLALFAACALAGLGFAIMAGLAMFALVATGLALLAAPFMPAPAHDLDAEFRVVREKPAAA